MMPPEEPGMRWAYSPFDRKRGSETIRVFDVMQSDMLQRNWLVSRKRTTNLGDLAAAWRRNVLAAAWAVRDVTDLTQELDIDGEFPRLG